MARFSIEQAQVKIQTVVGGVEVPMAFELCPEVPLIIKHSILV